MINLKDTAIFLSTLIAVMPMVLFSVSANEIFAQSTYDYHGLFTIDNPKPDIYDAFGYSVASTPDGNVLVGNPFYHQDNESGIAYLFDGTTGELLLTVNNPTPNVFDQFGTSVASTPNGDLFISAHLDDTDAEGAGIAYLFDGTTGELLLTVNNPTPMNHDQFGTSVASTPNGDLFISAINDNSGPKGIGSAYLFDGKTGELLLTINNSAPAYSDTFGYSHGFGTSVASTPDGNLLVGTPHSRTNTVGIGNVYLFDGVTGKWLWTINNSAPAYSDQFGTSVASTPDGNVLVGNPSSNIKDGIGSAYLFDGKTTTLLLTLNNPTPESHDQFGTSVASTPDGNLLVGAHYDTVGNVIDAGSVYMFNGTTGALLLTLNNPTPESHDQFGTSVASTPDGNLLVGAHYDTVGNATRTGSVHVFDIRKDNIAPVILPIGDKVVDEFSEITFTVRATDEENDSVSFGIFPALDFVSFVSNGNNTATFTANPKHSDSGVYNLNVTASDGMEESFAMFTLTVNGVSWYCGHTESYYANVFHGSDLSDVLLGTDGSDLMFGHGGDDIMIGSGADDCIFGGNGDDTIHAGDGNDIVHGNAGRDYIVTGDGNDTVNGQEDKDVLISESGNDVLDGGHGKYKDTCISYTDKTQFVNCEVTSKPSKNNIDTSWGMNPVDHSNMIISWGLSVWGSSDLYTATNEKITYVSKPLSGDEQQITLSMPKDTWKTITSFIDFEEFVSLPDSVGCPGCTDAPVHHITLSFENKTKTIRFESQGDIPEISDLSLKLENISKMIEPYIIN